MDAHRSLLTRAYYPGDRTVTTLDPGARGGDVTHVLLVDDDPVILDLLRLNFELEGYEVATANNGHEALAIAKRGGCSAVVLDVMMPELDGFVVCEMLRADPTTAGLPIIMLTARAQTVDRARGEEVGADAFVTKPFDPFDIVDLVARMIEEKTLPRDG